MFMGALYNMYAAERLEMLFMGFLYNYFEMINSVLKKKLYLNFLKIKRISLVCIYFFLKWKKKRNVLEKIFK